MHKLLETPSRRLTALVLGLSLGLLVPLAHAATITIVNADGVGEGFNDATPATPVGGNTGTTIGAQRLIVFQTAANVWGSVLQSNVTIYVTAYFDALTCNATSAVLGSAGPLNVVRDFPGAEWEFTWYHIALGNKIANEDLIPGSNDIQARFNSSLGQTGCLTGSGWYYGLDGNEGALVDLFAVVLHELGHGLGFSTTTSGSTGAYLSSYPSVYDHFLLDNTTGKHWVDMTPTERIASAINETNLVWDGPAVRRDALLTLNPGPTLFVTAPGAIAGRYRVGTASFGAALTDPGLSGEVVLVQDDTAPTSDACSALVNAAALAGKIAFIDRGVCGFTVKALAAQNAGAIGVIIANNVAGAVPPGLGGTDPTITIPAVSVTLNTGNLIRAQLGSGVQVRIGLDPTWPLGTDQAGHPQMYAPTTFAAGSSVSHWDVTETPNLLMEPFINTDLAAGGVDITPDLFQDIGWTAITGVQPDPDRGVVTATLGHNSPNPFAGATTIRFVLPAAGPVDLAVYDLAGRLVQRLARGDYSAGDHVVTWNGADTSGRRVASGIYFYRLTAGGRTTAKTMVLYE